MACKEKRWKEVSSHSPCCCCKDVGSATRLPNMAALTLVPAAAWRIAPVRKDMLFVVRNKREDSLAMKDQRREA